MSNTLRSTFQQALSTHNEALLEHVFDACTHHLTTLLEVQDFSAIRVFTQAIEAECQAYLTSAKAQQSMGIKLLKHVNLHRDHVFKIRNDAVAKAFAGKISLAEKCQPALYLMIEFAQQQRPHCCDEIYTPEALEEHLEFGDPALKKAFLTLLTSYFQVKAAPPDFWLELARKHQAPLAEAINFNDYWVGADLALAAQHFGMNDFCDAILPRILTTPKSEDYGHLLKLESMGQRFGGIQKKQIYVEAQRILTYAYKVNDPKNPTSIPSLTDAADVTHVPMTLTDQGRARTLITALLVFDFIKHGDYTTTSGEIKNADMRCRLAEAASYIWVHEKETRGDELLALLNLDFNELELAQRVDDFFDEDLYRHLDVTRADSLERDLGL